MKSLKKLGIIRFTSKERAHETISGNIRFGAAETYRKKESKGKSYFDSNEGLCVSYLKERDKETSIKLEFSESQSKKPPENDWFKIQPEEITKLEVRRGGADYWISCWYDLTVNLDDLDNEAIRINKELKRMRNEFGDAAIFICHENIKKFNYILNEMSGLKIVGDTVNYTDDILKIDAFNKKNKFSYQNEYRFVIHGCPPNSEEDKTIKCGDKLKEIIKIIRALKIGDDGTFSCRLA